MTEPAPEAAAPALAPVPRLAWLALALLMAAGAALRLIGLREQGLLYRAEEVNLFAAETVLADVRAAVGIEPAAPFESRRTLEASGRAVRDAPAGFAWRLLAAGVMAVVGRPAEWAGRALAAGCGLALIPLGFRLGRRWFGDWQGGVALAVVCAFVPSFVWWSRLALASAAVLLLLFAGVSALLRAAADPADRIAALVSGAAFGVAASMDVWASSAALAAALFLLALLAAPHRRRIVPVAVRWGGALLVVVAVHAVFARRYPMLSAAASGEGIPAPDPWYFPYWFWRREGVVVCGLVLVGAVVHVRMARRRPAPPHLLLLVLLLVLPLTAAVVLVSGRPLARYPLAPAYVAVALLAAGGLRAVVRVPIRGVGTSVALGLVILLLVPLVPLVRTRSGTREAAGWLRREGRAWLRSQGTDDAVLLVSDLLVPPVSFESRRWFRHALLDAPAEEAYRMLSQTSAYVFLVGEEGHLNPEWNRVRPLRSFARTIPRPALYVSESPGSTQAKHARLTARDYDKLAAYDAAALAAHADGPAVALNQVSPYATALAGPARFSANPVPADLPAWRREFRAALGTTLGLGLIETPHPLRAQVTERVPSMGYTRERVVLETEPGFRAPAFVLLPHTDGPAPFVLALHGHGPGKGLLTGLTRNSEETRALEEERRDFALQLVRRGYAVIAPDQRGFGELRLPEDIESGRPFSCPTLQLHAQLVGRTLIGDRVHDAMRWIDYARTRTDLDTSRIVVAGHSGGGTTALFTAALDERVDVAFVSGYFGRFTTSLGAFDLCECNYAPGVAALGDIPDIAALVAPRRLRLSLGRLDAINPLAVAKEALTTTRAVFDATHGTVDLTVGDLGHIVYPDHLWSLLETERPAASAAVSDGAT